MSRSGYSDDLDSLELGRWRGNVDRAIKGRRGQACLREMLAALDAMPVKELVADSLRDESGQVCALGALASARGVDVGSLDPEDSHSVAKTFDIARPMACEIVYINDEGSGVWGEPETDAERWERVRKWVAGELGEPS